MRKVLSTFPFYRWGNWVKQDPLMKLLLTERDAFWWAYLAKVKFVGMSTDYLDCEQKKSRFEFSPLEKTQKIKYAI